MIQTQITSMEESKEQRTLELEDMRGENGRSCVRSSD